MCRDWEGSLGFVALRYLRIAGSWAVDDDSEIKRFLSSSQPVYCN